MTRLLLISAAALALVASRPAAPAVPVGGFAVLHGPAHGAGTSGTASGDVLAARPA